MQIEVKIDSAYEEPKIVVLTSRMTDEIHTALKRLSEEEAQVLAGFDGDQVKILDQTDILRIYAGNGKVFAATEAGEYILRLRLYELENRLDKNSFVRISHSEIINLKKVKGFDLSLSGTICVSLSDGTVTYVSRRYVAKIRKVLGI